MKKSIELEQGWNQIQVCGIYKLIDSLEGSGTCGFTKQEYSELYTLVYDMCTQRTPRNYSFQLYERYAQTLKDYLQNQVRPSIYQIKDSALIRGMRQHWINYQVIIRWMTRFFAYLDRHHVTQNNLPKLLTQALTIFYEDIFCSFKSRLISSFVKCFHQDRLQNTNQRENLRKISQIFHCLEQIHYSDDIGKTLCWELQDALLKNTYGHFQAVSAGWIAQKTFPEYLIALEQQLISQRSLAASAVSENFSDKVKQRILSVAIQTYKFELLEKPTGIRYLLEQNRVDDMARTYRLFAQVDQGLQPICNALNQYIRDEGMKIVEAKTAKLEKIKKQTPDDSEFIDQMVGLLKRFKEMILEAFRNDSLFQRALKSAFEFLLNRNIGKFAVAEILGCYADRLLRKGGGRLSQQEIQEAISTIIELFQNLQDKDLFAQIYKSKLAKRLLNNTSANQDFEKQLISKMKLCCGSQFTSRLQGMLYDLHLAQDISAAFQDKGIQLPIDFNVQVLTLSYWPFYKNFNVNLPPVLNECIKHFNQHYQQRTTHKKLIWMNCLGEVVISGQFENSRHDFICSTYQACVLHMFNYRDEMTFEEIRQAMQWDIDTTRRVMITFIHPKYKLLEKSGAPKKISGEDVFTLRTGFQSGMFKINLPVPSREENFSREKVVEDRNLAIEAAIVRIMKSRKVLAHTNLITEVVGLLSLFRPQIRDIKSRIENLISREFLERDEHDSNVYHYLAQ